MRRWFDKGHMCVDAELYGLLHIPLTDQLYSQIRSLNHDQSSSVQSVTHETDWKPLLWAT
jgi:hypothetical protein